MNPVSRRRFLASSALAGTALATRGFAAIPPEPIQPAAKMNPVPGANNAFNADFFQQVLGKPGNVFFSSFSMEAAFGMLAAGAKGDTLKQMQKALQLPADAEVTHAGFKELFSKLNNDKVPAEKRGFELRVANALWGSQNYPWNKDYLRIVAENYGGGLFDTDFAMPEPARKKINGWVEQQTKEKIKNLLPEGSVTVDTRLVLTNAIYFKGKWELEFDKKQTKDGAFAHANGKDTKVPLMHKSAGFQYAETENWQAVELPYIGKETAMFVLLPKKRGALKDLQKDVTAKLMDDLMAKLAYAREVNLTLPKFKIETDYNLAPVMQKLGMVDAFDAGKADLSGLHTGTEKLSVTAAVHKAFVDVNEEGTEAAAATGIVVGTTSVPPPPKVFKADHPFVFAILHKPTKSILFFGKVESL
jgi:serpin B